MSRSSANRAIQALFFPNRGLDGRLARAPHEETEAAVSEQNSHPFFWNYKCGKSPKWKVCFHPQKSPQLSTGAPLKSRPNDSTLLCLLLREAAWGANVLDWGAKLTLAPKPQRCSRVVVADNRSILHILLEP